MVIGVTMVKVIPDHEKEIYITLLERDDIKEVYNLFGEYDLFVILEAQHQAELRRVVKEIRGISYVLDTWPLLVSRDKSLSLDEVAHSTAEELAAS
jgi:hypothetical protein